MPEIVLEALVFENQILGPRVIGSPDNGGGMAALRPGHVEDGFVWHWLSEDHSEAWGKKVMVEDHD